MVPCRSVEKVPPDGVWRLTSCQVNFKDDVRNCEDILLDEEEAFMLLSCDPGRDEWNTVMVSVDSMIAAALVTHFDRVHSSTTQRHQRPAFTCGSTQKLDQSHPR